MNWATFWSASSAIAASGVLVITGVYVWLTYRLARTAEAQAWEGSRARMSVSVVTNQGGQLFLLQFENIGASPAENIRAYINVPLHQQLGQNSRVTDAPFFQDGLRALSAHQPIRFGLGIVFRWLADDVDRAIHPTIFDVTITYKSLGKLLTEVFPINIEQQFSLSSADKDYIEEFGRTFPDKFEHAIDDLRQSIENAAKPPTRMPNTASWSNWFAEQVAQRRHRKGY